MSKRGAEASLVPPRISCIPARKYFKNNTVYTTHTQKSESEIRDRVAPRTDPERKISEVGIEFILDAYGPCAAKSVVDGSRFELTSTDSCSSYGHLVNTVKHTQKTWLSFCRMFILFERKIGHDAVITLRFDRAPELDDRVAFDLDNFRIALSELRVLVEMAPRNRSHRALRPLPRAASAMNTMSAGQPLRSRSAWCT